MPNFTVAVASIVLIGGVTIGSHHRTDAKRAAVAADTSASFAWKGKVPSGKWLRVRDLAGDVEVTRATGSEVEIHASRQPERWDWGKAGTIPVRFVVQNNDGDVVICAISADAPQCNPSDITHSESNEHWSLWNDHRPEPMRVIVALPAGVALQAATMHGDLKITDATAEVRGFTGHGDISVRQVRGELAAETGHGDIDVADAGSRVIARTGHGEVEIKRAGGAVTATSGHGDINVELLASAASSANDMRFETGHGSVHVTAPSTLAGNVDMRSDHGRVSSSFPLTFDDSDRRDRNRAAHGTLVSGARSVKLSSGHGDVALTSER